MALCEYRCIDCAAVDRRLGGLNDSLAICDQCGGLMFKYDEEVLGRYFDKISDFLYAAQIFHRKSSDCEIFSQAD